MRIVRNLLLQAEIQHLYTVNSELQRKLETQTQRLELAIQQQAHATPRAAYSSSSPTFITLAPSQCAEPQLQQAGPQLQPFSQQLQQTGLQLEPTSAQLQQAGPQLWTGAQALRAAPALRPRGSPPPRPRGAPQGCRGVKVMTDMYSQLHRHPCPRGLSDHPATCSQVGMHISLTCSFDMVWEVDAGSAVA